MIERPGLLERDAERARLEAALAGARARRGSLVSVEGEAGIGKTALLSSFIEEHVDDVRIYQGACESLTTPEPLGPLRDIARQTQGQFRIVPDSPFETYEGVLALLSGGRGPALLVLEDIHWADDATLDLLRYLGRRIATAPALIVVSFRHDAPDANPRLGELWADLPRDRRERIVPPPLSLEAVRRLARPCGLSGRDVFEMTGGNPFHVTEYVAGGGEGVPRSVQEATLARTAKLGVQARRVLECASLFPRRVDETAVQALAEDVDHQGVEECLRAGMLVVRDGALSFRHELARRAIHDAMSPLRRRDLHAQALALLKRGDAPRAAELAHHAEHAGAAEDLIVYSAQAAEEAAAYGAHREALAHLEKALAPSGLADARRAELLERRARSGETCGDFETAERSIEEAIVLRRALGEPVAYGNAVRTSSRILWQRGRAEAGEQRAQQALAILAGYPDTWQHAMAHFAVSQLAMVAGRHAEAIASGEAAMRCARALGREDIYLHALTNVATARCYTDLDVGLPMLRGAIEEARLRRRPEVLPRLYTCLTYILAHDRRYDGIDEVFEDGVRSASARENAPLEAYILGARATALLDRGRLLEAISEAEAVVFGGYPQGVTLFPALAALSRAQVRLGLPEGGWLEIARHLPPARKDLMRLAPLAVADAEAHWLGDDRPTAVAALRDAYAAILESWTVLWTLGDVLLWLHVLGERPEIPPHVRACLSPAHLLHIQGHWAEAAEAWRRLGCPYEEAIALSEGDEAAQRAALGAFEAIGAGPAARRLRRTMREQGVRNVPVGPRTARLSDPADLTPRQSQVLALIGEGLSNPEIAGRLGISAKTAEHHVGAVLSALGASSRQGAVQIAQAAREGAALVRRRPEPTNPQRSGFASGVRHDPSTDRTPSSG